MPTGAIIAGGLGAGSNLISGLIGSNAAQQASQAQVQFGQQALGTQQGMFNNALTQIQGLFGQGQGAIQPVINTGQQEIASVLPTLQKILQPGGTINASAIPGLSFATNMATTAGENAASATGLGGNAAYGVANAAQGLAQQGWASYLSPLLTMLQSGGNLAGQGAGAIGSLAGNVGSTIGNLTGNAMNTIGQTTQGIGQSTAQGILGSSNAIQTALQGGSNSISNAFLLNSLVNKASNANNNNGSGAYTGTTWNIP